VAPTYLNKRNCVHKIFTATG